MKNIIAIIPAYNEAEKIGQVVNDVEKYVNHIIIVDDGSKDNTKQAIKGKKTIILRHICNLGQGAAFQTGFEKAKELKADIVITYDADGQFNAAEIPQMVSQLLESKVDIALGSRFLGKTIGLPFMKLITLKIGIIFTSIFSGLKLTDTHNGFRAFNKNTLDKITIKHNRMAHSSEIIDQIKKHHLKFIEVPVTVSYDEYSKRKGQSPFNAFNIFLDLVTKRLY